MPPEPLPWERKDFFRERKHERSESLGSLSRWRDSSHHGSRDFNRWGSADLRRPTGHGKQGGWYLFPDESGNGCTLSRSSDKVLEDESCRPSLLRGDGKYGRNSKENRGSFGQRDWRSHAWDTSNGLPNVSRRPQDLNNEHRSVDDMLTYPSNPDSDFVSTWDQHHLKEQHVKVGAVNGLGTGQICDKENSLGSIDWKPLKWTRTGSLSSRGSGFSHSSGSRSIGGADSNETKSELLPKNATPIRSSSGDAAACVASAAPSEETTSVKKPRLGWGEGLAKYEKKKIEGPDLCANKDGPVSSAGNAEPSPSLGSGFADKSPKVAGFSDCASPATPSSFACSSSPGLDDKLFGKAASVEYDASNLSGSPGPGSQNHAEKFSFNLEKLETDFISNLGSSLIDLLQYDDPSSSDSNSTQGTAMNKLLIWKADISKVLEVTESEIDSLENKLKLLKTECGDSCPPTAAFMSLLVGKNVQSCEEDTGGSNCIPRPAPLQIVSSADTNFEKEPMLTGNLPDIHGNSKDEDIDSPGTATSKFVEPLPLAKAVSLCEGVKHDDCTGVDVLTPTSMQVKCLVPCTNKAEATIPACGKGNMPTELRNGIVLSTDMTSADNTAFDKIIASNKESAKEASDIFNKLLPIDCCKVGSVDGTSDLSCQNDELIKEKFAVRKHLLRFKERAITLKFRALRHLWKEDLRLLSVRKCRPKSHKKLEVSLRTINGGHQKHRSSIRSRFAYPAGNLSLVASSEIINFTSNLLSDSQIKLHKKNLKMPALILDEKEKAASRFISSNGLVEDPLAFEKEREMINPWTPEEKGIFMDKLATYGKDFRKIASFLDHKKTADCVEFYYKNHKSDSFVKVKKQNSCKHGKSILPGHLVASGKKWNRDMKAVSLEILSAASMIAGQADEISRGQKMLSRRFTAGVNDPKKTLRGDDSALERSNCLDIMGDERETVAADVLAGICGSLSSEAISSCITSSVDHAEGYREWKGLKLNSAMRQPLTPDVTQDVDDETCSDESCGEMDPTDWTDEEKSAFLQAVSSYGKDFAMISRCVGTRSRDQCKVFFSKARKCLGLDLMHPRPDNEGSPVSDNVNGDGGVSDTEDACAVQIDSAIGSGKSGSKVDDSDTAEDRQLATDLRRSMKSSRSGEVEHENVKNVDNFGSDSLHGADHSEVAINSMSNLSYASDKQSGIVHAKAPTVQPATGVVGRDKGSQPGHAVLETSAGEVIEPAQSNPFLGCENVMVAELASKVCRNQKEQKEMGVIEDCSGEKNDKYDTGSPIQAKCSAPDSCTTSAAFDADLEKHLHASLEKPHTKALGVEESCASGNSMLRDSTAIQSEKTVCQDQLSSTLDVQGGIDDQCHIERRHLPGNTLLDHVEQPNFICSYPLQMPIIKEVNEDTCCSSSVTKLPLLSHKIEQAGDNPKSLSQNFSDSDKTCKNGDVKLFGQILTNLSSGRKPNSGVHSDVNGSQHPKISSKSSALIYTGHHNVEGNSTLLKFDGNNYLGNDSMPIRSYGFWDGSRVQTGFPDSSMSVSLAKSPAPFSNYPASSPKIEQQSMQGVVKSGEWHLNGVPTFAARETGSSNGVIDYHMYMRRDGPKVQPFTVDVKHGQDTFSEIQRNGYEALPSLQQQQPVRGIVGANGIGTCTGISDPVAAIKMHFANSNNNNSTSAGCFIREEESWGGRGDIGR